MKKYFFLFAACFTIFTTHLIIVGHGIYGDGNGFYAYTQALYYNHGLDFRPVYNFLEHFQGVKGEFSRIFWDTRYNPFPIGTGLIWIPAVAVISLFNPDRFSLVTEIGPGLTGIIMALGGLYFLELYLRNFFSKRNALLYAFSFFFASNLFYYSSFEPALSHQPAFFIISFLLYETYEMRPKTFNFFLVGALSGLLFITRLPDAVLLIPIFWQLYKTSSRLKYWLILVISAAVFSLPLFLSYQIMFGNPFHVPYLYGGSVGTFTVSWTKILEFFFSAKRGLFIWTPIYLLGLAGLVKSKSYVILLTLAVLFLIFSFWSANTSAGFGQRFVLSGIPYFALGFGYLLDKIRPKYALILITVLCVWNFLTLFHFYFDGANMIRNENFTLPQFFSGQFQTPANSVRNARLYGIKTVFQKEVLD